MAVIPLVDLAAAHREIADEVRSGFDRVLERTAFILGQEVADFEREFAAFLAQPHCLGVANGTDALELALRACDVGAGHEVIVPANTFFATAASVIRAGATPVFVDCEADSLLMDVSQIARQITPHTKAIVPVHLYGQMAAVDQICQLAAERGLCVVEDAAQAHGARYLSKSPGAWGDVAAFSFYPGKNLGAYGDGGAVVTKHDALHQRLSLLRNWGSTVKYEHPQIGFNSRLDTLQAVVLSAKLRRLAAGNDARRAAAARYDALLAEFPPVKLPIVQPSCEHVFHLYVIRVPRRDVVFQRLNAEGIQAGIHYPIPLHLAGAFSSLGYRQGDFPVAEHAAGEILSLPLYPQITEEQQVRVVECLKEALA